MHEFELAGSYHEIGRQYASLLKMNDSASWSWTEKQLQFTRACAAVVQEHAPWLLEEIRGMASVSGADPAFIQVLPLTLGTDSGCSVVAVSGRHTRDGRPVFGRNYDFFASYSQYNTLYRTRPEGHLAHIGCSDHFVGRHDGLNEAGLAIGHSGPWTRHHRPGFVFTLAIRAVLDTCRTVAEAQTFLERIPHLQNSAFLVADAAGEIAAIDVSPEKVVTTRPADGFGFLANSYVSAEMAAYAPEEEVPGSGTRRRNIRKWIEARHEIGMGELQRLMADPETGVCQCAAGSPGAADPGVTLWSWTAVLGDPVLYLAKGTPNATPYEPAAL
jgi:predicted choloylglycine hydrolase